MPVDRWGKYLILSGNESPDTCFWCGKPCKNRYCSDDCKSNYYLHFFWRDARYWCLKRADHKCEKCGTEQLFFSGGYYKLSKKVNGEWVEYTEHDYSGDITKADTVLHVHHIKPTNGGRRDWSVLNRPENLMCLCRKCHRQIESRVDGGKS